MLDMPHLKQAKNLLSLAAEIAQRGELISAIKTKIGAWAIYAMFSSFLLVGLQRSMCNRLTNQVVGEMVNQTQHIQVVFLSRPVVPLCKGGRVPGQRIGGGVSVY